MVVQGCTLLYKVVKDCTKSCLSMLFVQILQVIITDSPQLKVAFKVHWGLMIQVSWVCYLQCKWMIRRLWLRFYWKDRYSFCLGSCDECYAATKLQKNNCWNILDTALELFFKFPWSPLEAFFEHSWNFNSLETPFELILDTLEPPLNHP